MRVTLPPLFVVFIAIMSAISPVAAAGDDEAQEATKIRNLPLPDTTDASLYTGNANDPSVCRTGVSNGSVWYRFQPKADGQVAVDTSGSNYDTVLAVFVSSPGQSARDLSLVDCNDDISGFDRDSRVSFYGERNVTYFIMVDTFANTNTGTLVLNAS